ncbi:hypothetical protein Y032_0006g2843 [Ancylostoma ceylanicum]|uniref:Uncharacterized protein n=1 Tax=Ancylostoma ceylanicum TaxID=53326 RepID=A0A016VQ90_9BILA|nr:hypothetical protein Y032_0006g2843 [Ancylostoma ceylanicum]
MCFRSGDRIEKKKTKSGSDTFSFGSLFGANKGARSKKVSHISAYLLVTVEKRVTVQRLHDSYRLYIYEIQSFVQFDQAGEHFMRAFKKIFSCSLLLEICWS